MKIEHIKSKRDEIVKIAKQHGATNIRVFGSVALGSLMTQATSTS